MNKPHEHDPPPYPQGLDSGEGQEGSGTRSLRRKIVVSGRDLDAGTVYTWRSPELRRKISYSAGKREEHLRMSALAIALIVIGWLALCLLGELLGWNKSNAGDRY